MTARPFIVERVRRRAGAPPLQKVQAPAASPAAAHQLAIELEAFAQRLGHLRAVGNNGDATPFYEDRSQAARDAQDFAIWARNGAPPAGFIPASQREIDRVRTRYAERH